MLKDEIVESVSEGKFHIWPVKTIDEGIEVLTGVPAGEKSVDGSYPEGSVNALVDERLSNFAERLIEFGEMKKEENKEEV